MQLKLAQTYEAWGNITPILYNEIHSFSILASLPMGGKETFQEFNRFMEEAQMTSKQRKEMHRLRNKYAGVHFPSRGK